LIASLRYRFLGTRMNALTTSRESSLQHRLVRAAGRSLVLALLALPALLGGKSPPTPQSASGAPVPAAAPPVFRADQAPSPPLLQVAGLVLSEKQSPTLSQPAPGSAPRPNR